MRRQSDDWIPEDRLKLYGIMLTVIQLAGLVLMLVLSAHSPHPDAGFPIGVDFRVFWAASHLVLGGDPVGVYDIGKMFATLQSIDPSLSERTAGHGWFYPPTNLLAVSALSLMPWWLAYIVFTAGTFAAYFAFIRKIAPHFTCGWCLDSLRF